jgi:uncharacterized membrane protein (DUF4010 family)
MISDIDALVGLATALGAGLLIGIERERRKGSGLTRAFAGVRTFAIASLSGALSMLFDSTAVAAVTLFAVAALAVASHWRDVSGDPGITTEVALIATVLVGMLAMSTPAIAAGAAIVLVALLFLRTPVQRFAVEVLSERELTDAIVLLSLALILLPLLPDRELHAVLPINAHRVVRVAVVMSAIQAFGYVMLRLFGARLGVPIAGLISGFVSSTATHAAMGARARANPTHRSAYVSAAAFSNVATAILAGLIAISVSPANLVAFLPFLLAMAVTAAVCGAIAFRRAEDTHGEPERRAFSLRQAFVFALLLTTVSGISAWIQRQWGELAASVTIALAALVDVHVAIAALVTRQPPESAVLVLPLLACLTINAAVKTFVTIASAGASRFAIEVVASLVAIHAVPWLVYVVWFV